MNESALRVIADLYPEYGVELWRHVQWSDVVGIWHDCQASDDLNPKDHNEYRVKPSTHIVNGAECPAPLSEAPSGNEVYYTLDSTYDDGISRCKNVNPKTAVKHMRFGIWLTYEDAIANRDAHYPGAFE